MSSSEVQRTLGSVLDRIAEGATVTIIRHGKPVAVMIPTATYEHLRAQGKDPLALLRARFDERFARMQTPEARARVDALFAATPEELGRAAVKAAKRRKELG